MTRRTFVDGMALLLLAVLAFWIFGTSFHRYSWDDTPIPDCAGNARAVIEMLIYLLWFGAAALMARAFRARARLAADARTVVVVLAVGLSVAGGLRYADLLHENRAMAAACGHDG